MSSQPAAGTRHRRVQIVDESRHSPTTVRGNAASATTMDLRLGQQWSGPIVTVGPRPPSSERPTGGSAGRRRAESTGQRPSIKQAAAASDRSVMDQKLFYPPEYVRKFEPKRGAATDASSADGTSTITSEIAPLGDPIPSLQVSWCAYTNLKSGTTSRDSRACAFLEDEEGVESDSESLAVPDAVALTFVRAMRDFFRNGVRYSRRVAPPESLSRSDVTLDASTMRSSARAPLSKSQKGGMGPASLGSSNNTNSVHSSSSINHSINHPPSALQLKIAHVEGELRKMVELRRKGSTAEIFRAVDVVGLQPVTAGRNGHRDSSELDVSSRRAGRGCAGQLSPPTKSFLDLLVSSTTNHRRLSTSQLTPSQLGKGDGDDLATATDAANKQAALYDESPELLPDAKLVDRFSGPSLSALMALSQELQQKTHTRLHAVQRLSLAGCGIGDDGCFVLLAAIRFGPLRRVQCLDLMHNQLTHVSAFYCGIFLLLRPPLAVIHAKVNDRLRASYEEDGGANAALLAQHFDPRQRALYLIGQKRATQGKAQSSGGASTSRQSPPFFFPYSDAIKGLVSGFFGSGSRAASFTRGGSTVQATRMASLRNVMRAAAGLRVGAAHLGASMMAGSLSVTAPSSGGGGGAESSLAASGAWFGDEVDEAVSDGEADSESESDEHSLQEHLRQLEAILQPTVGPPGAAGAPGSAGRSRSGSVVAPPGQVDASATATSAQVRRLQEQDALNAATELVSLRLGWNDLEDAGLAALSEWVACQTFLLELSVAYNDITNEGFLHLKEAIRSTTSMVSLNTDGNQMDDSTAEALRGTLLYNRRLLQKSTSMKQQQQQQQQQQQPS